MKAYYPTIVTLISLVGLSACGDKDNDMSASAFRAEDFQATVISTSRAYDVVSVNYEILNKTSRRYDPDQDAPRGNWAIRIRATFEDKTEYTQETVFRAIEPNSRITSSILLRIPPNKPKGEAKAEIFYQQY